MGADLLGRGVGALDEIQLRQQQNEFVSTIPTRGVGRSDTGGQARCHLLEQLVACRMAEPVVNALEPIKVEKQQCYQLALTSRPRCGLVEAVQQQGAIGQAG